MANCKSNCRSWASAYGDACNPSYTPVGALGMLCRANPDPYYTGPCPPAPCSGCGCTATEHSHPCEGCCCHGCTESAHHHSAYGIFAINGPLTASCGDAIALHPRSVHGDCFAVSGGNLIIRRTGVYHVSIAVDIPAGMDVDTVLRLELDGQPLPAPELSIIAHSPDTAHNYSGHAVFHAEAGSILRLVTLSPLCCPQTTPHPLITLTAAG